ncbi:hypothetical protein [Pyruvatibacter sp.]|uniref:hypothetical protein n=1 Tax=Pyruvatibacter sp. TaxID=1981328 RepID=UPI0032EA94E3
MPHDALRTLRCHAHFVRRARERGVGLDTPDIARIERLLAAAADLYTPRPDGRVLVALRQGRDRLRIVWDATHGCVISVWRS